MSRSFRQRVFACALSAMVLGVAIQSASADPTAFGVTANGTLFRFDTEAVDSVTTIGNLGIVPEAIDFRPLTATQWGSGATPALYAIDVGPTTSQLYTINTSTSAVTPIGVGFPSTITGQPSGNYNLVDQTIGFDFNPTTVQADSSIRIRVTASGGSNLRLNSNTGAVAAVDTPLDYPDADPNAAAIPAVDASAYINNNIATMGGTTTLYDIDAGTDDLSTQLPPNAGQLNTVGSLGITINALPGIGFDIYTDPSSSDTTVGGDSGYAVLVRPDTISSGYHLYDVNLTTGEITNGALVGGGLDFTGGFAVLPGAIPEPTSLAVLGATALLALRRRK